MKCGEQMDAVMWSNITRINQQRLIAADEEMGIDVKHMGKTFTDLVQQGWHILTF
jgi:hypothetical protein